MLNENQIKSYQEKGYLLVENAMPPETLKNLQDITDEFVESSRNITENDETYDLSDDHSKENPRLRRLKQPHLIHKTYESITLDNCILDPVSQLLGNNLRRALSSAFPFMYLPDNTPNAIGEYANKPTFSLKATSAKSVSKVLVNSEYAF